MTVVVRRRPKLLVPPAPRDKWAARFWAFHDDNSWVLRELAERALGDLEAGRSMFGIDGYIITIRWDKRETISADFKVNDAFSCRFSRVLTYVRPELRGYFETRNGKHVRHFDPTRGGRMTPGMRL